jgi:hypothetical protein
VTFHNDEAEHIEVDRNQIGENDRKKRTRERERERKEKKNEN